MFEFLLQGKSRLSCNIFSITMSPQSAPLQSIPGQYINLLGDSPLSLSIAEVNHDNWLTFHLRETDTLRYENFEYDQRYYFSPPLGTTTVTERHQGPIILISGGTGFAPFCRLIPHICANQLASSLHFYWGVNDSADLYAHQKIKDWQSQYPNILHYHPVINQPEQQQIHNRAGLVHQAVLSDFSDLESALVLASGPWPMIEAIQSTFYAKGLAKSKLLSDFIEPTVDTATLDAQSHRCVELT